MRQTLKLHADSRCTAATQIDVQITRPRPGHLDLRYFVTGTIDDLCLPPVAASMPKPARGEELWQHTCFEAFVRASPGAAYYEFNFAPSMEWAAYRFNGYRKDMCIVSEISAPRIEAQSDEENYQLRALLEFDRLPGLPRDTDWCLGVSAVIEDSSGAKSYWALAHPPGKADFHHADGFVHKLAATT